MSHSFRFHFFKKIQNYNLELFNCFIDFSEIQAVYSLFNLFRIRFSSMSDSVIIYLEFNQYTYIIIKFSSKRDSEFSNSNTIVISIN